MAMETLACGITTILSSNTGHIDLLENNIQHAIGVKKLTRKVDPSLTKAYGGDELNKWGETDPDELVYIWSQISKSKDQWRENGIEGAKYMENWSWHNSMERLVGILEKKGLLKQKK